MVPTQGGYFFFMFFMISFTAVKTTVNVSNKITSVIKTLTPFLKGAETAAVPLRNYTTNVAVVATVYHNKSRCKKRSDFLMFN